jgi:hypothetical protein
MSEMKMHDPLVLDVNGRKFGLVGSTARGLEGFYEQRSNGVLLQDMKGDPFVFIVGNRQAEFFFVSCSKSGEGIRYQHSTTSADWAWTRWDTRLGSIWPKSWCWRFGSRAKP